ncbi:MAG: transposase, partial [Victivallales bacterium]|nr:transposase [Victivallales bacterium]
KSSQTIAWDVDDVLNGFTAAWLHAYNRDVGANLAYKEITGNPPHQILGISLEEYLASLDAFRGKHYDRLEPVPEVLEWFDKHGHMARHVALSAVPMKFAPASAKWTLRHFGKWIRSFHFVPSRRTDDAHPMYDSDKASFLKWLANVDLLVEDNEKNARAAQRLGIETIIFPQPWNSMAASSLQESLKLLCGSMNSGGRSSRPARQVGQGRPAPAGVEPCRPGMACGGRSSRPARPLNTTGGETTPANNKDTDASLSAPDGTSGTLKMSGAGLARPPQAEPRPTAGTTSAQGCFTAPDWNSLDTRLGTHLPHWNCKNAIYHVVMRLADSLPKDVLTSWEHERDNILDNAKHLGRELTDNEQKRLQRLFSSEVEACLDRGIGKCWLRIPQVAEIIQDTLRHGDGTKYKLHAWCMMPSHVHVMVEPNMNFRLDDIVKSWTSFTGRMANQALDRHGRFWQAEPYDHIIRDELEYASQLGYVYSNPEKVGITDWPWRFRI